MPVLSVPPPWRCLCRCGRRAPCAAASRCAMVLLLLRPEDRFGSAEIAPTRAISARQIDDRFINWARAAYPRAAAHTRMVCVAGIRLGSGESARAFKGIICDDISEFESHMPSHAVSSLCSTPPPKKSRRVDGPGDETADPAQRLRDRPKRADDSFGQACRIAFAFLRQTDDFLSDRCRHGASRSAIFNRFKASSKAEVMAAVSSRPNAVLISRRMIGISLHIFPSKRAAKPDPP